MISGVRVHLGEPPRLPRAARVAAYVCLVADSATGRGASAPPQQGLTVLGAAFLGVGAMVGAGIFALLLAALLRRPDRHRDGGRRIRRWPSLLFGDDPPVAADNLLICVVVIGMAVLNLFGAAMVAKAQAMIVWVLLVVFAGFAVVTLVQMDPSLLAFSTYPS